MPADVGDLVHPWYGGVHEWQVKKVAQLDKPIEYRDSEQGQVRYDPKIILLESQENGEVVWFPYWISTNKAKENMKWGQRPSILEKEVFLQLLGKAIKQDMFSDKWLKKLRQEIQAKIG